MNRKRERLAQQRRLAGYSQEQLAEKLRIDRSTVVRWERGVAEPQPWLRPRLATALGISGDALAELLGGLPQLDRRGGLHLATWRGAGLSGDDEAAAVDLARRVTASDVGDETLRRLEEAVDDLAIRYPATPPRELLGSTRTYLSYVTSLIDARKTLAEHRRLLVIGGWLSLLAGTLHIDIEQGRAATARLATADSLAREAEHDEIRAWCLETDAWRTLTDGEYPRALELAKAAQRLAPRGSSAAIQATAQEGRLHARLGRRPETYDALNRMIELVSPLPRPDTPEHHYHYDPDKATSYVATTLAWIGDPAAESYARETVRLLKEVENGGGWPRRLASANVDLALALLAAERLEEASATTQDSMLSGRLVPSNHWRALEVVKAIEARDLPEAADLREAYEMMRHE